MTMDSLSSKPEVDEVLDLETAIAKAETVMLEVGTGSYPYIGIEENREQFDGGSIYIGWNIHLLQHNYLTEEFLAPNMFSVFAGFEDDTIFQLVPEESVDEVLLSDVLGEPNSTNIHIDNPAFNPDGEGYKGSTTIEEKRQTLSVVLRLLKPGGAITIVETITPYGYFKDFQAHKEPLAHEELIKAGFDNVEFTYAPEFMNPEEKKRLLGRYCINPDDASPSSYIVTAIKS